MTRPTIRDRGSGTLWTLTLMAVIWLAATVAMTTGGMRVARHRAHAATDLAALVAAENAASGSGAACELAMSIARHNGGRLTACVVRERVAEVTVTVPVRSPLLPDGLAATARARAGPVWSAPSP